MSTEALHDVRTVNGRKAPLFRKPHEPRIHEFRIAAFSCTPPCVCDGYEVALHHLSPYGSIPIWPVFNAASAEEAKAIQARLLRFASTIPPEVDDDKLVAALEAWALANGWARTHRVVWRRAPCQKPETR